MEPQNNAPRPALLGSAPSGMGKRQGLRRRIVPFAIRVALLNPVVLGGPRSFWLGAERASRERFVKAAHPITSLAPDHSNFDGTPKAAA